MTTTPKTYQAQLPLRNYRIVKPVPMPRPPMPPGVIQMEAEAEEIRRKLALQMEIILTQGIWFCKDCGRGCDRIEDDHGQPAHCNRCGSHRIEFLQAPANQPSGPAAKYQKEAK